MLNAFGICNLDVNLLRNEKDVMDAPYGNLDSLLSTIATPFQLNLAVFLDSTCHNISF